jgi:excisionase family DNA binding protein
MTEVRAWMTVGEMAEYLRFSKGNLYLKISRNVFPSSVVKKIGNSYRFDIQGLKRWLDEKEVNGNGAEADQDGGCGRK